MIWRRSGRPLIGSGGTVTGVFTLTMIHQALIKAWRVRHGCASASEAIRQMIEVAEQTDAAMTPGRDRTVSSR
jgi:hypothetical protein